MSLPSPFGRYELLEHIGSGGMADIFLARSFGAAGFERRLVIKRIRPEHARDPHFISLLVKEAKVGVHLNHPNLVSVYELGKVGDRWYIAMEYVHGHDLNKVQRALRSLGEQAPIAIAVRIIAEALRGLFTAHTLPEAGQGEVGLVHRDISPHNLLVGFNGDVKVVDFGIARLLDTSTREETIPPPATKGRAGGKFAYMSPEQARGEVIDARSDIYSSAVVLWELLANRRLYQGLTPQEKVRALRHPDIPDIRAYNADVDERLARAIQRALAADLHDRYARAVDFEDDLRAWLYDHETQPGRLATASWMAHIFPSEPAQDHVAADIRRLADDLRRLDASTDTFSVESSSSPERTDAPAAPPPATDEFKRVSVLVVDIHGFEAVSVQDEPERVFQRRLQLLRWLRTRVDNWGGLLQHVHDDLAYILFGVPQTRRDDHARALDCALDLQARVAELAQDGLSLQLAIGVHVGEITIGRVGASIRYNARGNTTRLARRLSEYADPGQVITSALIHRVTETDFTYRRGPVLPPRHGQAATPSWRLVSRRVRPRHSRDSAWIRRGNEIEVLRDALGALEQQMGATVLVQGATGSGKSRLVRELTALAQRRGITTLLGRTTPFGSGLTALRDLFVQTLGLTRDASEVRVRAALDAPSYRGLSENERASVLALMLQRDHRPFTVDTWMVLWKLLQSRAKVEPIVLVIEDIHLLSPERTAQLARLSAQVVGARILLLLTSDADTLADTPNLRRVELHAFSPELTKRHAMTLLGAKQLGDRLAALLVDACEGNPLYVQELIKYLVDNNMIATQRRGLARLLPGEHPVLPSTLAGLIAARMDALGPASKGALQLAAIIGTTFPSSLVADAIGIDDISPLLDELLSHGLIRQTHTPDVWRMSSDFVRHAALRGTLATQRRELHRLVAAAIERVSDTLQNHSWRERLALHCGEGGRPLDAARYAFAAGQDADGLGQVRRASQHYREGLRWLLMVQETPETYDARNQGEALLRYHLGVTRLWLGDLPGGLASLQIALDVAEDSGLTSLTTRTHLVLGRHYLQHGEFRLATAHIEQAAMRANFGDDSDLDTETTLAMATLEVAQGLIDEPAMRWQSIIGSSHARDAGRLRAYCGRASLRLDQGQLDDASNDLFAALACAKGTQDGANLSELLGLLSRFAMMTGRFQDVIDAIMSWLTACKDTAHAIVQVIALHHLADLYLRQGDETTAVLHLHQVAEIARQANIQRASLLAEGWLAFLSAPSYNNTAAQDQLAVLQSKANHGGDFIAEITLKYLAARLENMQNNTAKTREALAEVMREATRHAAPHVAEIPAR